MNLEEFDLIIINTSGGKDSQTSLDVVANLAKRQGVLDRVIAAHAILEEEWKGTLELVEEQCGRYGVQLHVMQRPQGTLLDQVKERKMWPSNKARFCTSDHKRGQIDKIITGESNRLGKKHVKVLNCMGLRAMESRARSKKNSFELDKRRSNGKRTVYTWLPIFEWSTEQVWANIKASGVRYHWAYDLGMPRLSCCFCIFAGRDALLLAGHHNKGLLEKYVAVEKEIGHTFRKELPIINILDAVNAGEQPGPIKTWEM